MRSALSNLLGTSDRQLQRTPMVGACRTITVSDSFLDSFAVEISQPTPVSEPTKPQAVATMASSTSTDSFDTIDEHVELKSSSLTLSREQIIRLIQALRFQFTGLPDSFMPGFNCILQKDRENDDLDINECEQLLRAIKYPLLSAPDHLSAEKKQFITLINSWHTENYPFAPIEIAKDQVEDTLLEGDGFNKERTLAGTSYFYDANNSRLIIMHAPIEVDSPERAKKAAALHEDVTAQILKKLQPADIPDIQHIKPTIMAGSFSLHSTLTLEHTITQHHAVLDPKKPVPLTNFFSKMAPREGYYYLGIQGYTDNNNCGRFIAILATITALLLAKNPNLTIETLTIADLMAYKNIIENAACCSTPAELKKLLEEVPNALATQSEHIDLGEKSASIASAVSEFANNTMHSICRFLPAPRVDASASEACNAQQKKMNTSPPTSSY